MFSQKKSCADTKSFLQEMYNQIPDSPYVYGGEQQFHVPCFVRIPKMFVLSTDICLDFCA